jgi:Fe-S cluster assembly protein SufD
MSTAFFSKLGLESRAQNPAEPAWLATHRNEAASRLIEEGLPNSKTEAWRFTTLRSLLEVEFAVATGSGEDTAARDQDNVKWAEDFLGPDESTRLFLVNGRLLAPAGLPNDVHVQSLAKILSNKPDALKPYLASHAHAQYFGALNAALFVDGVGVHVNENAKLEKPLQIVHISDPGSEPTSSYPRMVIVAEPNSEVSLIETYLARPGAMDLCTAVTELALKDGAHVDHLRIIEGNDTSTHIGTLAVHQERNSQYTSRSVVMGGKLSRLEIDARIAGPGADCRLDGVYHAVGNEHVAHHTLITHEDSNGSSVEEYRGLVDDRAHAVFDGIIVVKPGTKNTSAHQQNHNLLLSEGATINTKPHLEIDSDDLTASHGATIGALDPAQLFFLRARGIGEDEARAILTVSFVRSILDRIECDGVRNRLVARVLSRLPYATQDVSELDL